MSSRDFGRNLRINTNDSLHHQGLSSAIAEQSRFEQKNVNLRSSSSSSKFVAKSVSGSGSARGSTSALEHIGLSGSNRSSHPTSPIVDEPFSPSSNSNSGFVSPLSKGQHRFGSAGSASASAAAQKINNVASNLKQISYSISSASGNSSGSHLNMILGSKPMLSKHSIGFRTSSFESDPLDEQFAILRYAARTANPEDLSSIVNGVVNPEVGSAFSKIAECMTELAKQYKTNLEPKSQRSSIEDDKDPNKSQLEQQFQSLESMHKLLHRSCNVPVFGQELQKNLATLLRNLGILDLLLQLFKSFDNSDEEEEETNEATEETLEPEVEEPKINQANEDADKAVETELTGSKVSLSETDGNECKEMATKRRASTDLSKAPSCPMSVFVEQNQLAAVKLLGDCLTSDNRAYLLDNSSNRIQGLVKFCAAQAISRLNYEREQAAMYVLRPLLEHCEETCRNMLLQWDVLEALIVECRTSDINALRSCVQALANAALFGGHECQSKMLDKELLIWLFPLASHSDRAVKYFALLTFGILVANKELEAHVVKSGYLGLIHTLVLCSNPHEWAQMPDSPINNYGFGQSKEWLKRLVNVLVCDREEAKSIAAFHFAIEAHLKKKFGNTVLFKEINAIASLKKVASSPMAIASNFAAHALKCLGESVPHKLSQQVALWSISDVKEWITQIDFTDYTDRFVNSKVDGDLLLRLNETHLAEDIGMGNGLLRMRFMRELTHLKILAEYSNCDNSNIAKVLNSISEDYIQYTYPIINGGLDARTLQTCTKEQLRDICGIYNEIHAENIVNAFKNNIISDEIKGSLEAIDAFISYRRVGGSQLASLLKVHLTLKGLKVFLDVEKLQAGKFHHNLLTSIKQARHFILVLTPHSLDRCIDDKECNDWVHKEIVEALACKCNIIPITFDFEWPNIEKLPEDMRPVIQFNAVTWSHEYQEACVEKLLRFMHEEERQRKPSTGMTPATSGPTSGFVPHGQNYSANPGSHLPMTRYGSNPQLTSHHPPVNVGSASLGKHPPTYPRSPVS